MSRTQHHLAHATLVTIAVAVSAHLIHLVADALTKPDMIAAGLWGLPLACFAGLLGILISSWLKGPKPAEGDRDA